MVHRAYVSPDSPLVMSGLGQRGGPHAETGGTVWSARSRGRPGRGGVCVMSIAVVAEEWTQEWASQARCSSQDPDALFVRGKAQHDAKAVCKSCPVLAQ